MRLGWVGEAGGGRLRAGAGRRQPAEVPRPGDGGHEDASRLRGDDQGAGYRPEPYAIADA